MSECLKCEHDFGTDLRGRCIAAVRDAGGSMVYCGCECVFTSAPAEPPPTPEQIVYNVAQRDPRFRKYLIEQLTAMGDEQDIGPLRTLQPLQPEGEQVKTAILKVISGSDQWLFYDRRIGHTQRSDFADQVVALLDETGAQNGSGDETAKAVAREVINNAALPAGAVINAVEVDALYEGIVNALSTIHYPYVLRLARGIQRKYYAHVQGWEPLPTTDGVLSQIDNMIEGLPLATMSPATPSDAAMRAAEEIVRQFNLEKPGWVTVGRITIDRETETEKFERTSETATDRVAAIITRHFAAPAFVLSRIAALAHEGRNITHAGTHSLLAEIEEIAAAATTSPETPNNETVSDEYAEGFENGCAFTVAAFLENLGHLNYIFDGLNCCKICGLVKPAEGWKKQCKGPTGLRIDASSETPVGGEAQKCVKCGHGNVNRNNGMCIEFIIPRNSNSGHRCGCKCEFAAPVHAAGDDEGKQMNTITFGDPKNVANPDVSCPKCGGTKPTCCRCPDDPALTWKQFIDEFTQATIEAHVGFHHEKPYHECNYDVCVKRRVMIDEGHAAAALRSGGES